MEVKAVELKFLLKLLGFPNYRASITDKKLKPNEKTKPPERDRICRSLIERGIIAYSEEIKRFTIDAPGKNLLSQDKDGLPFTEKHFLILEACRKKTIADVDIKRLSAKERQDILQDLKTKGLIKVQEAQVKEVWLTDLGCKYLRNQHSLTGTSTVSLNLLQNYVNFLRQAFRDGSNPGFTDRLDIDADISEHISADTHTTASNSLPKSSKPGDEKILAVIQDLNDQLGTENYLPIFHLRQKLQPPLSRDELDQALYRLQRQDKIDMSSLVEAIHYTSEQIQAGIPQDTGSPLFFIMLQARRV